jgi:hypothetical protein
MKNSKFLKKEDVGEDGIDVTIVNVHEVDVAMEGQAPDMKWAIAFREMDKPMILNSTNAQLCQKFLGSDNTDDWIGKRINIYDDPSVSFGGKPVGGIRVRRARRQAAPPAQKSLPRRDPAPPADYDDSAPFPEQE